MVTKPCKHKPLATVAHPNDPIRHTPSTPNEETDGAVSTTFDGSEGDWNLISDSSHGDYVSVLDISPDERIDVNCSNNNTVRSGNAKIVTTNGKQAHYNTKDHDSSHFPRNHRLAPMKISNLGRGSVTNRTKPTETNDEALVNTPDCGKNFNKSLFPEIANVKIGATEFMSALGMRPLVCPFGYVEHSSGPELSLSFVLSLSCLISTNFSWRSKSIQNCNDYLFQILKKHQLTFRLRFPYQGLYTLEVYAQKKTASELPKNVFNYIIRAPNPVGESILPFPKAHKAWHVAGFVLKQPLDGVLPSNSQSKFVVRVLRAVSVFITSGGVSVDLQEQEDSWWIGLMKTGVAGSEIGLNAVFTVKPHTPVPLLSFRVVGLPAADGKTTVEMSAFEMEVIATEKRRLEQLLDSNREWLKKILEAEGKRANDIVSTHKARLVRLSRKQSTKTGHTKLKHKLKPQQKLHLQELLKNEQTVLQKARNDCRQRLKDIRKVESETIASIEAGGLKAIQEIRKSLDSFLHGLHIPQEKVTERLEIHMQLMAELEALQVELFSKNTWMEDSLSEISNIHEALLTAIADLQKSTLASLGLVLKKSTDQPSEVHVLQGLTEKEILDQLENMEQEELKEITDDAKDYVDGTGEMKHESIKQIYSLQIKEMQLQDAWIKAHEMRIFELQQISTPASEIATYLQNEIKEAMSDCKERLLRLKDEVFQQSHYLQDFYKERLSQFQKSEQEKLKKYETKLEATLATISGASETLIQQLRPKPREIILRLEDHLVALVQEIGARDLRTFLAIRDAIANNVFAEVEQAQTDMLQSTSSVISINTSGKQIIKTHIMYGLDPINSDGWKHAHRVLHSDHAVDTPPPPTEQTSKLRQKTRKLSDPNTILQMLSMEESEDEEEEEDVDEKSSHPDGTLTDARRCSFLMLGKNKDCKDAVLKLIEESTEQLKEVSISPAHIKKQSEELTDKQRVMTSAVLKIEDMLTFETKEILTYIIGEVYKNFQATMITVKQAEEERLLQARRVKRESMFEIKGWLKNRFNMMAAHDAKTAAKLKMEVSSMIDEMEKLSNRRIMCIKGAFENNEAKIKAHYQELDQTNDKYEEYDAASKDQEEQFHQSEALDRIKTIYNETVTELESKVNSCYGDIKNRAISEFESIEMHEQIKTNECKARVLEGFWASVREGEKEVVNELETYCNSKEREETEIAHDCIKGEEETMELIKTDIVKKCGNIDRMELRNRTQSEKVEGSRLEEIESLLKDNPWLWSEVKKEEEDRLLEKRIYDEERLFELENRQEETLNSLRASREMRYSQIEDKFQGKHRRLRQEFLTQGGDYVIDVSLTGRVRSMEEKSLHEIQNIHKEMVKQIKINDHRIFREMEIEIRNTFERISSDYQKMYRSVLEMQESGYEPFRTLEEQIRTSNRVELSEDDAGSIAKEMKESFFKVLDVREKVHLHEWLETVSRNGLDDVLKKDVISVEMILKSLDEIDTLRNEAISLDIRKMLQVLTRFQTPHHTIHEALKGILLALGDHEGFTVEWKNCMRRITPIGRTKLKWRVKKFILKELDPRIAKRSIDILQEVPFEKIEEISPELMTYCRWAWAVCEERLEMTLRSGQRTPEPADLNEQIQIFKRKYQSKGPVAGPRVLLFETDETLNRHTDQMLESRKKKLFSYRERKSDEDEIKYYMDT